MRYTPKTSMTMKFQGLGLVISFDFPFPQRWFSDSRACVFFREVRFKPRPMYPGNFLQVLGVPIRISFQAWMDLRLPWYISGCSATFYQQSRSPRSVDRKKRSAYLHAV